MRLTDAAAIRNQMNHRSARGSFDLRGRSGCQVNCLYNPSGRWAFSQCMRLPERSFTWAIQGLYTDLTGRAIGEIAMFAANKTRFPLHSFLT